MRAMLSRRTCFGALAATILRGQQRNPDMFANAEAYERFMGRWSKQLAPLLVDFAGIPDTGQALDVGSGSGSLAFGIARKKPGLRVVGIDPSSEYVEFANGRNSFPGRVRFEIGDAQNLPFPSAAFRASLSLLVFNFIPDPGKALRELLRVTRSRGRITAAVWDYGDGMRMLRAFWDAAVSLDPAAEKRDERHMPLCRAGELSRLWKQEGLNDVQEQSLDTAMNFNSFADYWDPFLLGQGPAGAYVQALPEGRLPALREALKRRLLIADERRAFTLPAKVWAVRGTVPAGAIA